ncbi:glycosyltransferase family 2 protein [Maribius pontilimi]|uniref:Glycosyltransferase family 2 protein n=2 Tax=Palleronia pontilimi TaxID=1964209 RepID=A0A934ID25_9RHOB|nr:glycosyltransferase family 2 protein [Palleronia pontilimi]
MMKDEGPYLLEWVAHHMAVGFTDLVVYTNDCTDGTDTMLMRLEELGLAYHRRNDIPKGMKPQPSAIKYAQDEPLVQDSDWVLIFDADEFLCIKHGDGSLDGMIQSIKDEGANGMVITWRIFGSGGVQHWSRDFVTEQYLMAAPPMWNKGWGVKTLFQFDPEKWKLGIHRPKMKNKVLDTDYPHSVKWLNGSGREMEEYFKFRGWRSIVRTIGYDWAQMNHYAVKSIDSYAIRKFRGNVNNKKDKYNDDYWSLQDRNEVRDDAMLRYTDRRREIFDGLLTDPVLNRLHFAALERAEARLAEFKGSPEYDAFVSQLQAASQVPITQVEAKPPKERDKDAIAAQMKDMEKRAAIKREDEKAKPPEERMIAPVDTYVRDIPDMGADPPMEWHRNHSVELPCDPRLFTPPGLIQITEGKFERNLARNLPKMLPEFAHVVEIGATSGFIGAHLAKERPDLRVTLVEGHPELRSFIRKLWTRNDLRAGDRLRLLDGDDLAALLRDTPADYLALGDPALVPRAVFDLLKPVPRSPALIALTGRLWVDAFAELRQWEGMLGQLGYTRRLPIDPAVAAVYARPEPLEPQP